MAVVTKEIAQNLFQNQVFALVRPGRGPNEQPSDNYVLEALPPSHMHCCKLWKVLPSCFCWGIDRRCRFGALEHVCLLVSRREGRGRKGGKVRVGKVRGGRDACIVLSPDPPTSSGCSSRHCSGRVISIYLGGRPQGGRSIRRRQIRGLGANEEFRGKNTFGWENWLRRRREVTLDSWPESFETALHCPPLKANYYKQQNCKSS